MYSLHGIKLSTLLQCTIYKLQNNKRVVTPKTFRAVPNILLVALFRKSLKVKDFANGTCKSLLLGELSAQ